MTRREVEDDVCILPDDHVWEEKRTFWRCVKCGEIRYSEPFEGHVGRAKGGEVK